MNSETKGELENIARRASAIVKCGVCGNYDVSASDGEANRVAYKMVTEAWKRGEFRGDSREEIVKAMGGVLDDANQTCPSCG